MTEKRRYSRTYAAGHYYDGCEDCRKYQRERVAANRAARLAAGRIQHGTGSAYDAGCRCDDCMEARRRRYPTRQP